MTAPMGVIISNYIVSNRDKAPPQTNQVLDTGNEFSECEDL